jgi:hypothetical protein
MGSMPAVESQTPLRFLLSQHRGSPIRRILMAGFAVIFSLWLMSAYVLGQRVIEAERRVSAISAKVAEGEEVLFSIRERVLLSSVLVRDAAFANGNDSVSDRGELATVRDDVERALQQYLPFVDSNVERKHWAKLRTELDRYWTTLSPLLQGELSDSAAQAFVRTTVIPQRKAVIRVSEDLRLLNQDALESNRQPWRNSKVAFANGYGGPAAWRSCRDLASRCLPRPTSAAWSRGFGASTPRNCSTSASSSGFQPSSTTLASTKDARLRAICTTRSDKP